MSCANIAEIFYLDFIGGCLLPDEVAYEISKILYHHFKEGVERFKPYGDFKDLFVDFAVPYHPGAEKYWKDVGLLRE